MKTQMQLQFRSIQTNHLQPYLHRRGREEGATVSRIGVGLDALIQRLQWHVAQWPST